MTTTTIWRARCRDCGLEQRRKSEPSVRRRNLFCHDCVHPIEWQRWEVSEERLWRVMDGADLSHFFATKTLAKEAMGKAGVAIRGDLTGPVRVARRTLRRVRG